MAGKRGLRTIVVDGDRYGWRGRAEHDLDGSSRVRLTAWLDRPDGEKSAPLNATFDGANFLLPGQVAKVIAFARALGWPALDSRRPFDLPPSSRLALDGLTMAGLPRLATWAPDKAAIHQASFPGGHGARLAAALHVPAVPGFDRGWLSPGVLIRDGTWTNVFTKSFEDLIFALDAGDGAALHADGLFVRSRREHTHLDGDDAGRVAALEPFPDARRVGDRVWVAGRGASARIECVTLGADGRPWRWLTVDGAGVLDRRTTTKKAP